MVPVCASACITGVVRRGASVTGSIRSGVIITGPLQVPLMLGGDPYTGAYDVTPQVEAQSLPTQNKLLFEDITVRAIPIYEVENESGGNTVFIASEV